SYFNNYQTKLEKGIASVLAYDGSYSNYDSKNLDNIIKDIEYVGFTNTDIRNIQNFILNAVIASNAKNDELNAQPNSRDVILPASTQLTDAEHLYKAYDVINPSLVKQAMNNTQLNDNKPDYIGLNNVIQKENEKSAQSLITLSSNNYKKVVLKTSG